MSGVTTTADLRGPTGLTTGARQVLLAALGDVPPQTLLITFFHREAIGGLEDYFDAITSVHGEGTAATVRRTAAEFVEKHVDDLALDFMAEDARARAKHGPLGVILAMPEGDFLSVIEVGLSRVEDPFVVAGLESKVNHICQKRGVHYRLRGVGRTARFEWTGDAVTEEFVLKPARSAMDDDRLTGAKDFFDGALDQLRAGTPAGRRRAVADGCSSVESALKSLLKAHGQTLPEKQNLDALIGACRDAKLFPPAVDGGGVPVEQILAAAGRFGNRRGRHGSEVPHAVEPDEAEAVVNSAATALTLIARRLP